MDSEVANCLGMIEESEEGMMREYVDMCIEKAEKPVSDTLTRPGIYTFNNRPPVRPSGDNNSGLNGIQLVTQMFTSLQARPEATMLDFFAHEN